MLLNNEFTLCHCDYISRIKYSLQRILRSCWTARFDKQNLIHCIIAVITNQNIANNLGTKTENYQSENVALYTTLNFCASVTNTKIGLNSFGFIRNKKILGRTKYVIPFRSNHLTNFYRSVNKK